MGHTQPAGRPMVARAIFGRRGVSYSHYPSYEMRPHRITERRDEHVDHYVGDRFSHRDTTTRYDTWTEDRAVYAGMNTIETATVQILFEDAENARMEVGAPWWERRGELVYVASHRGVGSYVYDLHSSDGRHVTEVCSDVVRPLRLRWPLGAGIATLLVQTQLLHVPPSYGPALFVGGAWIATFALHRTWRRTMLRLSRRRALKIVRRQIDKDASRIDEIARSIRARVAG